MPDMSHRAPTLNSEKETSRKSFSFWQSVIAGALRSYLCATVLTVYTGLPQHTHTHMQHGHAHNEKSISLSQTCHTCRGICTNTDTCIIYCTHTQRHVMPWCVYKSAAHTHIHTHTNSALKQREGDLRLCTVGPRTCSAFAYFPVLPQNVRVGSIIRLRV